LVSVANDENAARSTPLYIGLIADMVESRDLTAQERPQVQRRFSSFVSDLNKRFASQLAAKFVITLGDEFQGILHDPTIIPELIWSFEQDFQDRELRIGFGLGILTTEIPRFAINLDGPALHNARASIELAKRENWLGGVFTGFGEPDTVVLNGLARLLRFQRQRLKPQQRRVLALLRTGSTQAAVAAALNVTPQAVSDYQRRAGWDAYHQGEAALLALLTPHKAKLGPAT
jgi:SatD family (SatD)